ncbi:MAG: HAD hydrolase family protein, partial [Chitinophagaceae bacterium]
ISNELEFSRSFTTGEVKIPSLFVSGEDSQCKHDYCKLNALIKICGQYKVDLKNTLMIGDGENDICCLKKAGIGISFCSTSNLVDAVADYVIKEPDFQQLVPILN